MPEEIDRRMQDALAAARAGRGEVVLLRGPAGRGTTRRLSQAARAACASGMLVAVATGRRAERSLGFSVAGELLEPLWRTVCAPGLRAELAASGAGAAVALLEAPQPGVPLADGGYAVTRGLWQIARRLGESPVATHRPAAASPERGAVGIAFVVDDLHDVDAPSLGLLAYAAERLEAAPVTILAGQRSGVTPTAPAALAAIDRVARIVRPSLLDADAAGALVESRLPEADERFRQACVRACAGNAALLDALATGLRERGLRGSRQDATRIREIVPESVARLAAERLSRLPEPARALTLALSALERPAPVERLARSAGLTEEAALDALDAAVLAGVLRAEPQPAFAQPIMEAAIRASLTAGQRARTARFTTAPAVGRERRATLTAAESRVATLAAHGMTTRQIAQTLVVTPKTVEFHLRNVYAKLEIPSTRTALAQALGPREPVASAR